MISAITSVADAVGIKAAPAVTHEMANKEFFRCEATAMAKAKYVPLSVLEDKDVIASMMKVVHK